MAHNNINTLLDLDGMVIEQEGGYWAKFEVRELTDPTTERPHGIRYSLTLHDRNGTRVMGFDNAHAVKAHKNNRGSVTYKTYDHFHRYGKERSVFYEFVSAHQLLQDFWVEVDKTLKKLGIVGK